MSPAAGRIAPLLLPGSGMKSAIRVSGHYGVPPGAPWRGFSPAACGHWERQTRRRPARKSPVTKGSPEVGRLLAPYGGGELAIGMLPSLHELKYQGIHDATEELGAVSEIRELFVGFQRHLFEERQRA